MRKILSNLDPRWLRAASVQVCENLSLLLDREYKGTRRHVLAWMSFFSGEVDLAPFISQQLGRREIYLPRSLPDGTMTFLSVSSNWASEMEPGDFGIPEPSSAHGALYDPRNADDTVVLVPGLAFDRTGNRLGRARGYYDKFLSLDGMENSIKVGVAWQFQMLDVIPIFDHDIPVQWVCTEDGVLDTEFPTTSAVSPN